jgi:N-glycosylase/DNA lyase
MNPLLLECAVLDVARAINSQVPFDVVEDEAEVARHLIASVVSSRVRWETACQIAERAYVLSRLAPLPSPMHLQRQLDAAARGHRFPNTASKRLMALMANEARLLHQVVQMALGATHPASLRQYFVENVPGLGPKQASMFLRNLGRGRGLAVLDAHVMRFMLLLRITDEQRDVSSLRRYSTVERDMLRYADARAVQADVLDLAIWVVMRVARRTINNEYRDAGFRGSRFNAHGFARG